MKELIYGALRVSIAPTNAELGVSAAQDFATAVRAALTVREEIAVILATGNSQLSFVTALWEHDDIDWSRIILLHMDEYIGMSADHPASFYRWMEEKLVQRVHPKAFYGIRGDAPVAEEITRYTDLIRTLKPAICVMGIGENGHLAFNDPPADFDTKELFKIVYLDDQACRLQQVNEGHFSSLADVPDRALSLTVHALLQPEMVMVLTPETRKAKAVKEALEGPITEQCPASILQTAANARLYLDAESSALLKL